MRNCIAPQHTRLFSMKKKAEVLLLVVKLVPVYRKLLRSDYSCDQFLNLRPTWPFVISIKAKRGKRRAGEKYTSAQEPLEGKATPRQWSWVQNSREQLEIVKVPPCQLSLFPLKPRVDARDRGDVSAPWPHTWPFHITDRASLRELTWLNSCWAFLPERSPWPCGEHGTPGSPADLATLPRLNVRCRKTCPGQGTNKVTELFSANVLGGLAGGLCLAL